VAWLAVPPAGRAQPAGPASEPAVVSRPDASIESGTLEGSQAPRERTPAAQPPPSLAIEARRQFMNGERLFRAGRYREAARAYQRGYRLSHRPGFLINIAHCHVRLGRLDLAREQYRQFLAEATDARLAAQVSRALADIDAQLAPPASPAAVEAPPERNLVGPVETPPLPLGVRDRLHQPSAAEQALDLRAQVPPEKQAPPLWLWPAVGVGAAAVVLGTFAVFASRNQPGAQARGSIGTIRR
jgi:tetratricopeptide (TPR) repeat protein